MPLLIVKKRILNVISRKAAFRRCLFYFFSGDIISADADEILVLVGNAGKTRCASASILKKLPHAANKRKIRVAVHMNMGV